MTDDMPEATARDFRHAIPGNVRERIQRGDIRDGADVRSIRRWSRMRLADFAAALGMSPAELRRAERAPSPPPGPVRMLLRIAARDPRVLRQLVAASS